MRIIGGKFGGRIIKAPSSLPARPTTDYARSGLFNILTNHFDFEGLTVLDLFAGIGSIGFEFISRGAKSVTSVDSNAAACKFIREFAAVLGANNLTCIRSDVFRYLQKAVGKYDIVFADPPFELTDTDRIPGMVMDRELLNPGGWLIVEHQSKRRLETKIIPKEIRTYGNCSFSIFANDVIQ